MPLSLQRKKGVCRRGILSMAVACPKKQRVAMSAEQIEWERMRTSTLLLNTAHKSSCLQCKKGVCSWGISSMSVACHWMKKHMVGQNHIYIYIYTVYIRYFWLGNHQIYGVFIRIYTVLANPKKTTCCHGCRANTYSWPEPYICTVYDRIFDRIPAKNTVYTPYTYGSVQPYN